MTMTDRRPPWKSIRSMASVTNVKDRGTVPQTVKTKECMQCTQGQFAIGVDRQDTP